MNTRGDRFTRDELGLILRAAADRAGRLPVTVGGDSFSLDEIVSIAREVGVDPEGIANAAALVTLERRRGPLGSAGVLDLRGEVAGKVTPERYGALADAIGDAAGVPGRRTRSLGALHWESGRGASSIHVAVTPEDSVTAVRVHGDGSALKGLCFVASLGGALAASGIAGAILEPASILAGVGIMAGAASAGLATGWAFWRHHSRRLAGTVARVFTASMRGAADLVAEQAEGWDGPVEQPGTEDQANR